MTLAITCMLSVFSLSIMIQANAQAWTLTPKTQVGFNIRAMGFSLVKGQFTQFQSNMKFDPTTPQNASAQLVLQMNSVRLNKSGLKDLLLGEGFFFVEQYPTARFNSREFIVLGNHQYDIKGDLTLRGITQPVTLKTRLKPNSYNPQMLDVEAKTVVKREDFGMKKSLCRDWGKSDD